MKGIILAAALTAMAAYGQGVIPKCNYKKIVKDYEETIGIAKLMAGVPFDVVPTTDEGRIVASMVRETKPIKSGKYKGMVQRQSYKFSKCKLYWAFNEKFDPEDEDTFFETTGNFRDDGTLQAVCEGTGGIHKFNPMRGEMYPNMECDCFNKNGRPTKISDKFGCED